MLIQKKHHYANDSTELLSPLAALRPSSTLSTLPENPLSETHYRYSFVPHSRDHGSNLSGAGENYGERGRQTVVIMVPSIWTVEDEDRSTKGSRNWSV